MAYEVLAFRNLDEGMDASNRQDKQSTGKTRAGKVYKAVNATNRRGSWKQRPGFLQLKIKFPEVDPTGIQEVFQKGRFQGAHRLPTPNGETIISVHSGRILRIDPTTREIAEYESLDGDPWINPLAKHCWFAEHQCGPRTHLIINDGMNAPVFISGKTIRRSLTDLGDPPQIPTGTVMASCSRLLTWADQSQSFIFHGDRWSANDDSQDFTNQVSQYFLNDGAHGAPLPIGKVTGMTPMPVLDTGSGYGPLLVGYEEGWITIRLDVSRQLWPTSDTDIVQTVTMKGIGNQSPSGIQIVNADVFFWGRDGLRTLSSARQETQSRWSNTPLSRPVSLWLDQGARNFDAISTMLHHDRLYSAATPFTTTLTDHTGTQYTAVLNEGLIVMDFYSETYQSKANPVWDGLWTGIKPEGNYSLVSGKFSGEYRGFIFGRTDDGNLRLYEIREDFPYDTIEVEGNTVRKRIPWYIETFSEGASSRYFDGSESVVKIEQGYMNLSHLYGKVDMKVEMSPSIYPEFFEWRSLSLESKMENCDVGYDKETCAPYFDNLREQSISNIVLGKIRDSRECSQHLKRKIHEAESLRFRISFDGAAQLDVFDVVVSTQPRAEKLSCSELDTTPLKVCNQSDFGHDIYNHPSLP